MVDKLLMISTAQLDQLIEPRIMSFQEAMKGKEKFEVCRSLLPHFSWYCLSLHLLHGIALTAWYDHAVGGDRQIQGRADYSSAIA